MLRARLLLVSSALLLGCSYTHLYGSPIGDVDLQTRQRVHVFRHAADKHQLDRTIAARLARSGYQATHGPVAEPAPADAKALVSYEDHWMWDMSMYLLVLRIDFRDPDTNELLATGQSYRTSLERKPAEFMVDEIVTAILAGG